MNEDCYVIGHSEVVASTPLSQSRSGELIERISVKTQDMCSSEPVHTFIPLIVADEVHDADQLQRNTTVQNLLFESTWQPALQ